jgi:hypothetical protein
MNKDHINTLQEILDNESCNTTYTQTLGEYTTTNTIHENIKIYYELNKESSYVCN